MPTDPSAPQPSPLGQRIAGGALLVVCGPMCLFVVWHLVSSLVNGTGAKNPGALAYMISFAGLTGLLAAFGLRMILRSRSS